MYPFFLKKFVIRFFKIMGKEHWARQLGDNKKPGPADYSTSGKTGASSPAYSIKQKYPEKEDLIAQPYVKLPTTIGESPRYTIRPQTELPESFATPGPSYIPPAFGNNYLRRTNGTMQTRSYSIDSHQRSFESNSCNPNGPAAYDTRYRPNDKRAPAFRIGEGKSTSWIRPNNNPAAAAYHPNSEVTKPSQPKYTISSIHTREVDNSYPGPGEYDTKDTFGKRPLHIGSRTLLFEPFQTPGPGRYDHKSTLGEGSPRTAIRPLCPQRENNHGVPYRKLNREFDNPKGKTISPRTAQIQPFSTPGPGQYSPRRQWNNAPGHKMSPKSGNEQIYGTWLPKWTSPGPAEYNSNDKSISASAPSFSLRDNVGPTFLSKSDTPGPDFYSPDKSAIMPKSPRFSIRLNTGNNEAESPTKDAGYVALNNIPHAGPSVSIRPKEDLDLIPK